MREFEYFLLKLLSFLLRRCYNEVQIIDRKDDGI